MCWVSFVDEDMESGFPKELLQMNKLRNLSLKYQGLVSVPPEISQMKSLALLYVSNNPHLLTIDAQVARLPLQG
jgi:hypothetical protein